MMSLAEMEHHHHQRRKGAGAGQRNDSFRACRFFAHTLNPLPLEE
jgi:hypothetical protein